MLQIEKALSPYEKEKLQERLAKFVGGVAIVHVGGFTESEMREKKDRVDDALQATKAALEEGIVPGGGAALIYAREAISNRESVGGKIVYKACSSPFVKILTNAGYEEMEAYGLINELKKSHNWVGYNLKTEAFVNMKEEGIIDPTKVTRTAIENAASVAGTILLTECTIVDKPEDKKQDDSMGGMGGMF
jgi:chaperonin GroEL